MLVDNGTADREAAIRAYNMQYDAAYFKLLAIDGFVISLRMDSYNKKPRFDSLDQPVISNVTGKPLLCTDLQWWIGFHGDVIGCRSSALVLHNFKTGAEVTGIYR